VIPKLISSSEVFRKPFSVDKAFGKAIIVGFGILIATFIWELIKW
jgi:hypothetical protein